MTDRNDDTPANDHEPSRALVARAAKHDRAAIEDLLLRHLPGLEGYLRLRMGPVLRAKESASDLLQSLCREVLVDLSRFEYRGEAAFRHWLYAQAAHKLIDRHRGLTADKRDPAREVAMDAARSSAVLSAYGTLCTPSRALSAREAVQRIEQTFDKLRDDYKEAITLHRMVGLSHAEIAAHMGRSEGAVRNLVYRGLAQLAIELGDQTPS